MKHDWSIKGHEKHLIRTRSTEDAHKLHYVRRDFAISIYGNIHSTDREALRRLMTKYRVCEASYCLTSLLYYLTTIVPVGLY